MRRFSFHPITHTCQYWSALHFRQISAWRFTIFKIHLLGSKYHHLVWCCSNRSRRSRERRDANRQATEPATDLASEGTCELPTDCRGNLLTLGVHDRRSGVGKLEPENDEGNVEYKLRLKQNNPIRFQQLVRLSCPTLMSSCSMLTLPRAVKTFTFAQAI